MLCKQNLDYNMKIYEISQNEENGYDTYSSAIVIANTKEEAANVHPSFYSKWEDKYSRVWCSTPEAVYVKELGIYTGKETIPGVILASFHAG